MQQDTLLSYSKVLFSAYVDWFSHLSCSKSKRSEVMQECLHTSLNFISYSIHIQCNPNCPQCRAAYPTDRRFKDEMWSKQFPFNLYSQLFLSYEHILNTVSTHVPGVLPHHEHLVNFTLRQVMDAFSPTNYSWSNPIVIKASLEQFGHNFARGYINYVEDVIYYVNRWPPVGTEGFKVGINLAMTPGKVIYRNQLIELIQYTPTTSNVYSEPILIIPAWIMKYYILDLSPSNSIVKFLLDQGHTVFMISWKNPSAGDHNLAIDDYMHLGIMDALSTINDIIPQQKVHCVGYCIGGTLLMLTAAFMAENADARIKSITLLAAQVDFTEAGELRLFIDEEQVTTLEKIMHRQGYLSGEQMANCFSMLHAKDLIWSRYVQDYLLGSRYPLSDMMAWNADTTRLPYKMHSEYLRKLYLYNEFALGKFKVKGKNLDLSYIKTPLFVVSTLMDHVAPWKSVYKIHNLSDTDITYVLTGGGHNSGILSEPGHLGHSYQMLERNESVMSLTPEVWQKKAPEYAGSWWAAWEKWLAVFSSTKVPAPKSGSKNYKVLCNAPGTYVLKRYKA